MDPAEAHPAARAILNEPFFWSRVDDYAPNGNDTGFDVLHAYRTACQGRRKPPDPAKFLRDLLAGWRIDARDWYLLEGAAAARAVAKEPSRLLLDDALIGLAFAVLKVQGVVPQPLREITLIALDRQALDGVMTTRNWRDPMYRRATLGKMRAALEAAPSK